MRYSYSSVSAFGSCPYKWKLRYKDRLTVIPDTNPDNALYLGTAIHKGIETGNVEDAIALYKSHYHQITDKVENWIIQIEYQVPQVLAQLPPGGQHELEIKTDDFIGYADYICGDTLYDFKFSNNIDGYRESPQLSIYKYYLEKTHPDIKINHLVYVFVPKLRIRQKKTETVETFRNRLRAELKKTQITFLEVPIMENAIKDFKECCNIIKNVVEYPKNQNKLCAWCEFEKFCKSGITYDLIRRD